MRITQPSFIPIIRRFNVNLQLWVWAAITLSMFVCVVIAWLSFQQQQILNEATTALGNIRQARIELSNGFLHVTMADQGVSSFVYDEGIILLEQAMTSFEQTSADLEQQALPVSVFRGDLQLFREQLAKWTLNPTPQIEADLLTVFRQLESQADYLDIQIRQNLQDLSSRYNRMLRWTLGGAIVLLSGVCTAVFFVQRASETALEERARAEVAQQLARRALRESESRFRQITDLLPQLVWTCDIDGSCDYLSQRWTQYTGIPTTEQLGFGWLEQAHPEDQELILTIWKESVAADTDFHAELRIRRHDGVYHWFDTRAVRLQDENGRTIKWLGSNTDIHEERIIRETLRQEQERFAKIVATAPGAIHSFRLRPNNLPSFPYASPAIQEIYGLPPEKIREDASEMFSLIHPGDLNYVRHAIAESARTMQPFYVEFRVQNPHKGEIWVEARSTPTYEPDGSILWHGILVDITQRKEQEKALYESELRYKAISQTAFDYVYAFRVEADGQLVREWDTEAFQRITGYTNQEIDERGGMLSIVHPDDLPIAQNRQKQLLSGNSDISEFRIIDKSGNIHWLRDYGRPEWDTTKQQVIRIYGAEQEVTEKKEAEEQLKYQADLLRKVSDAIISTDANFCIQTWNKAAELLYGWTEQEVVGRSLNIIVPTEYLSEERLQVLDKFFRNGYWQGEVVQIHKDGSKRFIQSSVTRLNDSKGDMIGGVAINRDITERKRAEEEIRQLNAELEQRVIQRTGELEAANRELEAFSYSISHDLRAPLRSIIGFSQAVMEEFAAQLPPEGHHFLRLVQQSARHMTALIDGLLNFSRLSRQPLHKKVIQMYPMVQDVLQELRAQQGERPFLIHLAELPLCHGDPVLLRQVWSNLLSNALKFTQGNQETVIKIASFIDKTGETVYSLQDNGAGFDMRYSDKLFGVFQRLHRTEEFEGTGVGLAIVQRIIQRHGGRIWAEAAVNQGATFYFTIPSTN